MAVSRERLDALYNELFGRTEGAEDAGYQYWRESGLTGEELRDALIAGAGANDRAAFDALQGQYAEAGPSEDRIRRIYMELFGRGPREEGLQYWMSQGLTGEQLRDSIAHAAYAGREEGNTGVDFSSYQARQGQLARGDAPAGYRLFDRETGRYIGETGNGNNQGNQGNQGGGSTVITGTPGGSTAVRPVTPTVTIGQPGQGGGVAGGVYGSGMVSGTTPMINPYTINPYSSAGGLTPELLDAYRFQEFYNQGLVAPPIDRGIGSLSYFGIPPSQIQASLSGF